MILDTTSKSLQIVLSGAPATTQPTWFASWADLTATAFTPDSSDGIANGTTPVTVVAAPAASTQRQTKQLTIYNADTANVTVSVQLVNGANTRVLFKTALAPGQTLEWMPTTSWIGPSTSSSSGVSLGTINVWTKNNSVAPVVNNAATGTITPDASASNNFDYLQTGNITIANPTNLTAGMVLNFRLKQDATGTRSIAFGSKFKWPGGTVPTWVVTANAINFFSAYYDSASDLLLCNGGAGYA